MPRIVIATFGSFGDVHPYIALGKGLLARGHSVTIATTERYRAKVEREGIGFHAVRPDFQALGDETEILRRVYDPRRGAEYLVRELFMRHIADSFDDLDVAARDADLLVGHALAYGLPLLARSRGLPWASTVLSPMVFMSAWDPPILPPMPWLRGIHRFSPRLYRWVFGRLKGLSRSWSDPLRRFACERGLPQPDGDPLFEGKFSPHLTLAMFSPLLATAQLDWPAHVRITGFPFHDDNAVDGAASASLAAFLDAGEAPIVFTLGSSATFVANEFFHRSAAIAARLGRRAVLVTGPLPEPLAIEAPDNVFVAGYAPYSNVFPRAAAIVHNGGVGTLAQGMRAGKPMLVVPFSHDQPDNAERAARLGIARVIPQARFSVERGEAALAGLLGDPRHAANASTVSRRMAGEDGVAAACDALERLLDSPRRAA
jgi:UDP:flavonoid glycosyltransferase YjiC (YdhE family)